jgi:hypothetical protein
MKSNRLARRWNSPAFTHTQTAGRVANCFLKAYTLPNRPWPPTGVSYGQSALGCTSRLILGEKPFPYTAKGAMRLVPSPSQQWLARQPGERPAIVMPFGM